jgi:hypothetical protein
MAFGTAADVWTRSTRPAAAAAKPKRPAERRRRTSALRPHDQNIACGEFADEPDRRARCSPVREQLLDRESSLARAAQKELKTLPANRHRARELAFGVVESSANGELGGRKAPAASCACA